MAGKYPKDRVSITFTPAFDRPNDLDHEGPTRKAYLTDTYGLVIHTSVKSNMAPAWTVAHTRSGYAVGYADTWNAALTLAAKMGECGTWNRDREEIEADKPFCAAVTAVIRAHGTPRVRRAAASVWG